MLPRPKTLSPEQAQLYNQEMTGRPKVSWSDIGEARDFGQIPDVEDRFWARVPVQQSQVRVWDTLRGHLLVKRKVM
jgi:hypothetical protein